MEKKRSKESIFQGIVLAGGKSSRFGDDKALARIDGRALIEIAVDLLDALGLNPVIIAHSERDYSFLNRPIHFDRIPEQGPLGGLYTAACLFGSRSLVILSCDMPSVDPDALKLLLKAHDPSKKITLFSIDGQAQPFPGIYEADIAELLLDKIRGGRLSMRRFVHVGVSCTMLPVASDKHIFANINRKEDILKLGGSF